METKQVSKNLYGNAVKEIDAIASKYIDMYKQGDDKDVIRNINNSYLKEVREYKKGLFKSARELMGLENDKEESFFDSSIKSVKSFLGVKTKKSNKDKYVNLVNKVNTYIQKKQNEINIGISIVINNQPKQAGVMFKQTSNMVQRILDLVTPKQEPVVEQAV